MVVFCMTIFSNTKKTKKWCFRVREYFQKIYVLKNPSRTVRVHNEKAVQWPTIWFLPIFWRATTQLRIPAIVLTSDGCLLIIPVILISHANTSKFVEILTRGVLGWGPGSGMLPCVLLTTVVFGIVGRSQSSKDFKVMLTLPKRLKSFWNGWIKVEAIIWLIAIDPSTATTWTVTSLGVMVILTLNATTPQRILANARPLNARFFLVTYANTSGHFAKDSRRRLNYGSWKPMNPPSSSLLTSSMNNFSSSKRNRLPLRRKRRSTLTPSDCVCCVTPTRRLVVVIPVTKVCVQIAGATWNYEKRLPVRGVEHKWNHWWMFSSKNSKNYQHRNRAKNPKTIENCKRKQ